MNKFFNYISFIIISILFGDSSQIKIDTLEIKKLIDTNIDTKYSIDTLNFYDDWEIIESRIEESKTLLAEAIIADMTGDTLNALFKFEILFESLAGIKIEENINEFYYLEFVAILRMKTSLSKQLKNHSKRYPLKNIFYLLINSGTSKFSKFPKRTYIQPAIIAFIYFFNNYSLKTLLNNGQGNYLRLEL